jgi:N-methylhydantoinase B
MTPTANVSAETVEAVTHRMPSASVRSEREVDAITTEVIRNGLHAAAQQMKLALCRTAFSPVIYEMIDFCCALYDEDVRLLAQARAMPSWLGRMDFCIRSTVEAVGGRHTVRPGDVLFSTYGFDIGSHPQDAAVITPIFFAGDLCGYAIVSAHQMDIGAKDIYCTDTVDNFQEGAIFPGVKLYRGGVRDEDMYRTVLANSRLPAALGGDISAEIIAGETGARGLLRLMDKYGRAVFRDATEQIFDHGERSVRSVLERIPDGRYVATGALDSNGVTDDMVPFQVTVEVSKDEVLVDFSESPEQQAGPMNTPLPTTISCARYTMMFLVGAGEDELVTEGHLRPIAVRTKPGTMFHPLPPAPIFLYGWPARNACDSIHRALADAMPASVPAGNGGCLCGVIWWGRNPDGSFWGGGADHGVGQGATLAADGGPPLMHISGSGIRYTPAEVIEARFPFVVRKFELAPDSGGAGRERGGLGLDVHYELDGEAFCTAIFERSKTPPWGLFGGHSARANIMRVHSPEGTTTEYCKATALPLPKGTLVELHTGGGGGYGDPAERDPERIAEDLREGYISKDEAARAYPHAFQGTKETTG